MNKNYEAEARVRWGETDAYRECEQKTKNYTKKKWLDANEGLMEVFAEFAACKASGAGADSDEAQALAAKLQAYSRRTTTPARTRSSQGLARRTFVTDASKRI